MELPIVPAESTIVMGTIPVRARRCPCGKAHLANRTLGTAEECRQCGRERHRGCKMWTCRLAIGA
eukprot:12049146-Karenia_brevis.AAC.1